MALFVDDELVMAPSLNATRYDGELMVPGIFTRDEPDEARRLATTLQTGALPIELSLSVAGACESS